MDDMEDVDIEVEDAPDEPDHAHEAHNPNILKNQTPNLLLSAYSSGIEFLQSYGWFIVIGIIALLYLWIKLQPYLRKYQKRKQEEEYYQFDADVTARRQDDMDAARRRLQERFDAQAERFKETQKQKEEEKRKNKIEDWERHQEGRGYRSKYKPPKEDETPSGSKPKPKRPQYRTTDYNPLIGGGGGGYRPGRRGGAAGGG